MRRVDLRKSPDLFKDMKESFASMKEGEVLVVLFKIGDFSDVEKSFAFVEEAGLLMMNSLKFNQVDWTITVKKASK